MGPSLHGQRVQPTRIKGEQKKEIPMLLGPMLYKQRVVSISGKRRTKGDIPMLLTIAHGPSLMALNCLWQRVQ
jgi:hypothetical protein